MRPGSISVEERTRVVAATLSGVARPFLRRAGRWFSPTTLILAGLCFLLAGWGGLVWGFFVSSVLSHHATFTVNSLCHLWGRRRYATPDDSRNNWAVAVLTLGEGWHNNHHHYQGSANQGFFWWEIDLSYYALLGLRCCGLVWDLRKPGEKALKHRGLRTAS